MNFPFIKRVVYGSSIVVLFIFSVQLLAYYVKVSDWHDFDVFYYAAKAALEGRSIYIIVGKYDLPFWYFPWTAWFFIPMAVWEYHTGLTIYKLLSLLSALVVIWKLAQYYKPGIDLLDVLFIISSIIPMSIQLVQVGQMDYILLGLIVAIIFFIDRKMGIYAGLLIPFIWIKPHLVIIFTFFAFFKSGMRTVIVSFALTALMFLLETAINPGWHIEMLNLLEIGSKRVDGLKFSTFPSMMGFQENWVGTANLPFTLTLIAIAFLATWRYKSLPTPPLLSIALSASLFCAPRAYAYDLPLLIPGMIWISRQNFKGFAYIWLIAAFIPLVSRFDSITYLVTLMIFVLSLWNAHQLTKSPA